MENLNSYFYHVENIGSGKGFFIFSLNLKFFELSIKKESKTFSRKSQLLHLFYQKNRKILD